MLEASNPDGVEPTPWEGAASAIDGNLATKWLDANITKPGGRHSATLLLSLAAATPVASYDIFTANWPPRRDPSSWTFAVYRPYRPTEEGGGVGGV